MTNNLSDIQARGINLIKNKVHTLPKFHLIEKQTYHVNNRWMITSWRLFRIIPIFEHIEILPDTTTS